VKRAPVCCLSFQTDVFSVAAVDVGRLSKVVVGHTRRGRGKGWFCESVRVRSGGEAATTETLFPCGHWLDTGCEDRAIERELRPLGDLPVPTGPQGHGDDDDGPQSRKSQCSMQVLLKKGFVVA
jgi:hypothetical protein